jgi:hypothetical protein
LEEEREGLMVEDILVLLGDGYVKDVKHVRKNLLISL